jgi:TonB family protein
MSRGWLDKAEEFLERSLAHLEQALGKEHSSLIVPLFLLAELHQARTDYDKAEPFYRRALTIKEREAKPNSADAERIRARYACALWKSERYDEARALKPSELGGLLKGEKGIVGTPPPSSPISVLNSKALSLPKPTYPLEARKKYVSGEVLVGVVVNEEGNVIQACALWGDKLLAEVSENAARKARFTPTLVNGQPIKVSGTIKYNFVSPR